MRQRSRLTAVVLALCVTAGCGGSNDGSPRSSPTTSATAASSAPTATTTPDGTTLIEVAVTDGNVTTRDRRPRVALGSRVRLRVTADVTDEVHVHAYDKAARVTPTAPAVIDFVANIPGIVEIELEESGVQLLRLEVR